MLGFIDENGVAYPKAYLHGGFVSLSLQGVDVELSYNAKGTLSAAFQTKDFMRVSRLDMKNLLWSTLIYVQDNNPLLHTYDGVLVRATPNA